MAHLSVWQRSPFRKSFSPSRRQCRQTAPVYRATSTPQTRRRLGGRQPLCGMGVTSLIRFTVNPAAWRLRSAASRPAPGPFTKTCTWRMPSSAALRAAASAATWAAKGVPLREPLKPTAPALDHATTLPCASLMVMMVLLKVEWMCTTPSATMRLAFLRRAGAASGAAAAGFSAAGAASFCFAIRKPLSLRGRRLLARDGAPRPLARARVGVRPLPPDRQVPPVAEPAVAAEIDQALDARRDVAAEVALDLVAGVDRAPKTRRLLVGPVVGLAPGIDLRLGAHLERRAPADAVDVREGDLHPLVARQIHSGETCHAPTPAAACGAGSCTARAPRPRDG